MTAIVSEAVYNKLVIGSPARFNFYGSAYFYQGTVSNLTGQFAPTANYALPPSKIPGEGFHVTVAIPALAIPGACPLIGQHGAITFRR